MTSLLDYLATGKACYLRWAHIGRNIVNGLIDRAKANYIISQLRLNKNNPKKCWPIIHDLIVPTTNVLSGQRSLDRTTNVLVDRGDEPHFLNPNFVNNYSS